MPFFPLCNVNKTEGYCTIHNFPPNNWEEVSLGHKYLWAIYSDGSKWITKLICKIGQRESKKVFYSDFELESDGNISPLIILQLRKTPLNPFLRELPKHEFQYSSTPEWRATVGFKYLTAETSYQGEINPFPNKASLLTFHPFIQYSNIENYFVFVNLESSPVYRETKIEIYNSNKREYIDEVTVRNNSINLIPLNKYNIKQEELPIFLCRNMAGIPFGLGINDTGPMLSLEHTHPPASLVVHGPRWRFQKDIKERWFSILKKHEN